MHSLKNSSNFNATIAIKFIMRQTCLFEWCLKTQMGHLVSGCPGREMANGVKMNVPRNKTCNTKKSTVSEKLN